LLFQKQSCVGGKIRNLGLFSKFGRKVLRGIAEELGS